MLVTRRTARCTMPDNDSYIERIAALEADNKRLRGLLDQKNVPGELRHRLRNTVAMLRNIIRKSAQTERDLEGYSGHIEDRLDALARAQAAADDRGSVELHRLMADELFHYGASDGGQVHLTGPDVELQPRAGQVFALAVHELAVNAVEHGALGTGTGRITIAWQVANDTKGPHLSLTWEEHDTAAELAQPTHEGFGTEVLTRTLPYELKASCTFRVEKDGLRCSIDFPLPEQIGRVVESESIPSHEDDSA